MNVVGIITRRGNSWWIEIPGVMKPRELPLDEVDDHFAKLWLSSL